MNPIIAYIKAVRIQNLAIIALMMFSLKWLILKPLLAIHEVQSQISDLDFTLLTLSVMLIAGAGNIINDYFDIKIDRINKPDKIIVGRYIKRRVAMVAHMVMNGVAILLAGYVAYKAGVIELALIQVIWIASLWFYSTDLKRRFVWGNVIIAFCIGLVPLSVAFYEIPPLVASKQEFLEKYPQAYPYFRQLIYSILYWCLGYAVFAFLLTFSREITKDIIDQKGDLAYRCKTIPITLGTKKSKWIINLTYAAVIVLLFGIQHYFLNDKITLLFFILLITPTLLFTMYLTRSAQEIKDYYLPSLLNKITSVLGILYGIVVYYILS